MLVAAAEQDKLKTPYKKKNVRFLETISEKKKRAQKEDQDEEMKDVTNTPRVALGELPVEMDYEETVSEEKDSSHGSHR